MKRWIAAAAALCLLTGCAPLLERSYSTAEPHSSKYWESEAADTLRAENDQDIVNDLLILIGQHTESATLRLYPAMPPKNCPSTRLRVSPEASPA